MAELPNKAFEARALALMREALQLFDSAGGSDASATLQQAVDIAERRLPMTENDILDRSLVDRILGPLDLAPRGHNIRLRDVGEQIPQDADGSDHSDWERR